MIEQLKSFSIVALITLGVKLFVDLYYHVW
jgi:hypothetical protein